MTGQAWRAPMCDETLYAVRKAADEAWRDLLVSGQPSSCRKVVTRHVMRDTVPSGKVPVIRVQFEWGDAE